MRSHANGFTELDLANRGAVVREVRIPALPGPVESARRLLDGHTVVIGNGAGEVFVWELDRDAAPVAGRQRSFDQLEKARMIRLTPQGSFLFCTETQGRSRVHEGSWNGELQTLFEAPDGV